MIERSLVDHFVPFLPLERRHVRQCAQAEARHRAPGGGLPREAVDSVVDGMTFWPEGKELFSTTGCKRVAQKVDVAIEELLDEENDDSVIRSFR